MRDCINMFLSIRKIGIHMAAADQYVQHADAKSDTSIPLQHDIFVWTAICSPTWLPDRPCTRHGTRCDPTTYFPSASTTDPMDEAAASSRLSMAQWRHERDFGKNVRWKPTFKVGNYVLVHIPQLTNSASDTAKEIATADTVSYYAEPLDRT